MTLVSFNEDGNLWQVFKVYTRLQGHLTGGHLNGGLPGTFSGGFRGGILRGASRYFQRGLKGALGL